MRVVCMESELFEVLRCPVTEECACVWLGACVLAVTAAFDAGASAGQKQKAEAIWGGASTKRQIIWEGQKGEGKFAGYQKEAICTTHTGDQNQNVCTR